MLKSRIKPLKYSNILIPDYNPIRSIKRFRVWKFSQNVYKYIKNIDELNFSFYGYPSYLEVNYKLHLFTVIRLPSYKTIIYPFNMDIHMFYDYFERKAYFQNLSR